MLKLSCLLLSCAASTVLGDLYYAFYNDFDCTKGEGTHVDSTNDGCLTEYNRKCVAPAGGHAGLYYPILIGYSDDNCQEEIGCNAVDSCGSPGCTTSFSEGAFQWGQKAQSFKFKTNGASPSTCPNACTGECPGGKAPTKRHVDVSQKKRGTLSPSKREMETRQAKNHDYGFCSNDDCTDCGTSIEPANGGCSIEGSRKSVYYNGSGVAVLSGYTTEDQTCKNDFTGTVRMDGKGCYPLKSSVDGGPNAYQITTFSPV